MKKIKIDDELLRVCPNIQLGCIEYSVNVEDSDEELLKRISDQIFHIEENMELYTITEIKSIKDSRALYKMIGKDPYKYRISSEALLRRIIQKKGLYKINNVVDANNLISIVSGLSVGSYDVDKLGQNIIFRIGKAGEKYKGIGKNIINMENLPVFSDEFGVYGSPTSDSERAMIVKDTKNVLTILISFSENLNIEDDMTMAMEILKKYLKIDKKCSYIVKGN